MAGIQLTGLASGMDWKTTVEQLMKLERIPQDALKAKKAAQAGKQAALDRIKASVTSFSTAAAALNTGATSSALRTAKMLSSTVTATGAALPSDGSVVTGDGAVAGTYEVAVTQVATPASLEGESYKLLAQDLSDPSNLNTLKLSDYGVKAGNTLTVNGTVITIDSSHLAMTVKDFLGVVAVALKANDGSLNVELTATGFNLKDHSFTPTLGSPSDSGDVLGLLGFSFSEKSGGAVPTEVLKYSETVPSAVLAKKTLSSLGVAVATTTTKINGVSIPLSPSATLGSLISTINSSSAGVTAYIDPKKRSLVLTSNESGGQPISIEGDWTSILGTSTAVSSQPFKYTLKRNGQPITNPDNLLAPLVFTSPSSKLDLSVHGLGPTSLSVPGEGSYKFEVAAAAQSREKIDAFIKAYNDLRLMVNDSTKTTVDADGKVTSAVLAGNRDVQTLLSTIRSRIFSPVKDPGSVFPNIDDNNGSSAYYGVGLDSIGIGFNRDGVLQVLSESKLTTALSQSPAKVSALFSSGASSVAGTGTKNSSTVSVSSTTNLVAGQVVSGAGIPSGTTIQSVGNGVITLSKALTSNISSSSIYLPVANQGIAVRLGGWLSLSLSSSNSEPGLFKTATSAISSETKSIQTQIDAMERRLEARQKSMEASFIAMEKAQSRSQNMLTQISNAFKN